MNLNLDNFEGDFSRETPYILTSPTSLKACLDLGVQPNELVYRNLEEYEESLSGLPLSEIYRLYEENETARQEKLLKCRDLRHKLKSSTMAISTKTNNNNLTNNTSSTTPTATDESSSSEAKQNINKNSNPPTNNKSNGMRRYTSAPAVDKPHKSNVKHSVNFQNNNLKGTSSGSLSARTRSRSGGYSGRRLYCTSDTESTEGHLNIVTIDNPYCSSRSVPDLSRSNLDFRKLSASPRHLCPCNWEIRDRDIAASYLRRYGDLLDSPDLTLEDRKIMERLILKKGRSMEWEKKSQELRHDIEKDRVRRFTENQLLMQSWHDKLAEKRRIENLENTKRYLDLQGKSQESRSNLMRYLEDRDRRVQKYLEDINYKKKKSLIEKQKREALRQLEVGKAIEKLVEEDRQHRQILRDKLQRRMEEADVRKRRREREYWRHIAEVNRMEDIKRSLKLERVEQKTRESVEELRNQIEEKEHRARMNYLNRIRIRNRALSEGSGSRQKAMEKAQAIHSELLKGLEDWHKKVLDLHLEAQRRAEMKYSQEMHRRRVRVASERILREERSTEMLKKVHQVEEQRKDLLKAVIETKECKSAKVMAEKERRVRISRIRAQHAAELRQQLKDKIDPETFDRKAARVEMELRIMKRNPPSGFSVKFNPKLISKRCSSCHHHSKRSGGINGGGGGNSFSHCGSSAIRTRGIPLKPIH